MSARRGAGERCAYCERVLESTRSLSNVRATRDHVEPRSRGGRETVWCCRRCNTLKADLSIEEWRGFMAANPEWWRLNSKELRIERRRLARERLARTSAATDVPTKIGLIEASA
jgi:hypothetical protein